MLLLVIMAVVIALVMSIASRSLSDTVLSRQDRESSAAFSVAETGIENAMNALKNAGGAPVAPEILSALSGTVTGNYAVTNSTSYGLYVPEGETAHLDTSTFAPGTLTISWTKKTNTSENVGVCTPASGGAPAAIEISAIKSTTANRSYFNPFSCSPFGNGFTDSLDGGATYRSKITFSVAVGTTMVRIKPIYSGATISVTGSGLSTQLYLIQSKAKGGDAQKEIEVRRGLDAPASIFDFAVFTPSTIVK